jgi:proline iminopeptidase
VGAADALLLAATAASPIQRGYTPSDVPPRGDVYTYKHFYTDALAVLDHLEIDRAHLVGLSMGSYSSLQIGLNAPERAVDDAGRRRLGSSLENLDAFRAQCRANAEQYEAIGSGSREANARGASRFRFC